MRLTVVAVLLAIAGCAPATGATAPPGPIPATATAPSPTGPVVGDYPWDPPAGEGKACPRPAPPAGTAATEAGRVLVLGDSLVRETPRYSTLAPATRLSAALEARGWLPTIVCYGGKSTTWGTDQLPLLRDHGLAARRLIVSLGTNDLFLQHQPAAVFEQRVRRLLDSVATTFDATEVWWVDLWVDLPQARALHRRDPAYDDMATFPAYNAALRRACSAVTSCHVITWSQHATTAASAGTNLSEPGLDGVHLSAEGSRQRAELVAAALGDAPRS